MFKRMNARARRAGLAAIAIVAPAMTAGLCEAASVPFPISAGGTGNAYELFLDTAISQADARNAASAAGGHLVTITSSAEQTFVESLLSGDNAPTGSYWIGLDRVGDSDSFTWETGEPFGFDNFAASEPNDFMEQEDAGQIYWSRVPGDDIANRKGTWNDAPVTGFPADVDIPDLRRAGYVIEIEGAGNSPGGGDGGPVAIPLPPALLAAPLGALVAGLAARRRRVK
jgi:hypothetical protein